MVSPVWGIEPHTPEAIFRQQVQGKQHTVLQFFPLLSIRTRHDLFWWKTASVDAITTTAPVVEG